MALTNGSGQSSRFECSRADASTSVAEQAECRMMSLCREQGAAAQNTTPGDWRKVRSGDSGDLGCPEIRAEIR